MKQNKFLTKLFFCCVCIISLANCKTPFEPPVQNAKQHTLVVEGLLNGNGMTSVTLSRTRNISTGDTAAYIFEDGANVRVEDNHNNVYPLYSSGKGIYTGYLSMDPTFLFRLHITTTDNKEYESDFVPFKQSPPIDEIGWKFKNSDVQVYANTHDPQNNTHYYRWQYEETWEFHSEYYSVLKYDPIDSTVKDRYDQVYQCWRSDNSTSIQLGSSVKLKEDVINQAPITLIPFESSKISVLYSILVTQYALDSSGYNYWNAMKSNTENVGSIFDPQPNQTKGNIHCLTDSLETVIGYIGAGAAQQSRLFISHADMPVDWNQSHNCTEYNVPFDSLTWYYETIGFSPIKYNAPPGSTVFSASGSCVDCTLTGTNIKPPFWP
jgi:hypothetical protein